MSLDILIALFFLVGCLVCSISERRSFNGGICRACGKALKRFDTDSQGGRGYTCGVDCCFYYSAFVLFGTITGLCFALGIFVYGPVFATSRFDFGLDILGIFRC